MNSPSSTRLKLGDMAWRQSPQTEFARLLARGAVFRGSIPVLGKSWFATTWESVSQTLRQTDDFVRDPKNAGRKGFASWQWILPASITRMSQNMLVRDGDDHRRLRTLVDQAFQRQNISLLESRIAEIVDEQLDKVAILLNRNNQPVDLVEQFCRPIPLTVICELLGLPGEDRARFMKWFRVMSNVSSVVDIFRILPAIRRTMKYLEKQFEDVRRNPRPGLITALVEAEEEGQRLSEDELVSMVTLLLLAGHETTVHLLSNSILTLWQFESTRHELNADWSLADSAIDEILRYTSVIHIAKPRLVTRDMSFHGQDLRRGESIVPLLACTNYDTAVFENPGQFDIHRSPNRHMAFGSGPHICLGLKLARAETRIALQQLVTRFPHLQCAFDPSRPEWGRRIGMRTLKSLNMQN